MVNGLYFYTCHIPFVLLCLSIWWCVRVCDGGEVASLVFLWQHVVYGRFAHTSVFQFMSSFTD